jgi:Tol biopolymer transport system component
MIAFGRDVGRYGFDVEIWIVGADGSDPHRVGPLLDSFAPSAPDWSPDGALLAIEGNPPDQPSETDLVEADVYVMQSNTFDPKLVALGKGSGATNSVAWSQDGSAIATTFGPSIVLIDPTAAQPNTVVTRGKMPQWNPQGRPTTAYRSAAQARCAT